MLIISLLFLSHVRLSVFEFATPISLYSHLLCLDQLPKTSHALPELRALVCAENFPSLSAAQLYITSGLIHLFVVSGAHLILLEKILQTFLKPQWLILVLLVYALACGLSPPVTRSLIAFTLGALLIRKNIKWPPHLKILVTGLLTLLFNFQWIVSFSLQMSWIAAFLVSAAAFFFSDRSILFRQSLFFAALLPTIVFFQIPGPSSILLNIFFAPVLELLLFPLGLLVGFFNFLHPLFDKLILLLKVTLQKLELDYQIQTRELPSQLIYFNWALILLLHAFFHILFIYRNKKNL